MIELKDEALKYDLNLSKEELDKFETYYNFLLEYNNHTNLTRIVEHDEVMIKHFLDSIIINKYISFDGKDVLDIGAGPGFPSMPLAIINSNTHFDVVDSNNKKTKFLSELKEKLSLSNTSVFLTRAEDLEKTNFEHYDIVTARAVARLNILVELTIPFVKKGGYFIALKAADYLAELDEAKKGIETLGGTVEDVIKVSLPYDMGDRVFILIKKIKNTPTKYPRMYSQIKNKPL